MSSKKNNIINDTAPYTIRNNRSWVSNLGEMANTTNKTKTVMIHQHGGRPSRHRRRRKRLRRRATRHKRRGKRRRRATRRRRSKRRMTYKRR
jgi:hypothetical protein